MNNENAKCEIFEPLISGMLDGELTREEQECLSSHLESCARCANQLAAFEQVNQAVRVCPKIQTHVSVEAFTGEDALAAPTKPATKKLTSLRPWRLIPLASAAALLLALGIMIANDSKTATADQITSEQIVEPMKDLYLINQQLHQDQQLMLRTLGMDLRLLKVEVAQLEPDSAERQRLSQKLDEMVRRVQEFETQRQASSF